MYLTLFPCTFVLFFPLIFVFTFYLSISPPLFFLLLAQSIIPSITLFPSTFSLLYPLLVFSSSFPFPSSFSSCLIYSSLCHSLRPFIQPTLIIPSLSSFHIFLLFSLLFLVSPLSQVFSLLAQSLPPSLPPSFQSPTLIIPSLPPSCQPH